MDSTITKARRRRPMREKKDVLDSKCVWPIMPETGWPVCHRQQREQPTALSASREPFCIRRRIVRVRLSHVGITGRADAVFSNSTSRAAKVHPLSTPQQSRHGSFSVGGLRRCVNFGVPGGRPRRFSVFSDEACRRRTIAGFFRAPCRFDQWLQSVRTFQL
jgi:hypothetical protein